MEWKFFQEYGHSDTIWTDVGSAYHHALQAGDCREDVQYHYEYTPYGKKKRSGTILETHGFRMIELPPGLYNIQMYIDSLRNEQTSLLHDRSAQATCLYAGDMKYIFFGFAPFDPEFDEEYKRMIALNLPCYSTDESRAIWLRELSQPKT